MTDHSFFSIKKRTDGFFDLKINSKFLFSGGTKDDIRAILDRISKEAIELCSKI